MKYRPGTGQRDECYTYSVLVRVGKEKLIICYQKLSLFRLTTKNCTSVRVFLDLIKGHVFPDAVWSFSYASVQEERLVHGKLEELAYQFNTLLTSQLNEQRHFYQKQAR